MAMRPLTIDSPRLRHRYLHPDHGLSAMAYRLRTKANAFDKSFESCDLHPGHGPLAISYQLSAIDHGLLAIRHRLLTIDSFIRKFAQCLQKQRKKHLH
jgi:hypothetical protein